MLAIRMQRTGRKKQAQFRVIVQESHYTPTSGKVVAYLGSYNPHTKTSTLDTEKAKFYLDNGAQPSDRVAKLLQHEKVELPSWVKITDNQSRATKNPDKLRKNQPKEEVVEPEEASAPADEPQADTEATETTDVAEAPEAKEETPADPAPEAEDSSESTEEKA